eukprot:CAMPEP_0183307116 /NCGR_PEP_ID=MMETSP0160_2-20130417/16259_1 /TAXON_ID=2839 ORGANISM="Odontella Sinensis, Strain Grunow 1884" /NCGR_SAMPLE_ID=MMETSP0160_2 /ASSEMBLY_ACC=CAM_ASM_000250 /LENGTH=169 /DNA_ID=CAMNT_0025470633 /DNA_START=46 /DNA_END=555 /DNA_ORIENTATION=-
MPAALAFGGGSASGSDDPPLEESTPYVAASDGDLSLLQRALSELNLPPNAADSNGFTFVHAAAAYCRLEVLRWLFGQEGVDPNAGDSDGDTPLHHCDEVDAARALIEEGGAEPSRRNAAGKTARETKEEELEEINEDEEDSDDEDQEKLKLLVQYLKSLEGAGGDEDMK